jgi:DNA ligase-1
MLFADLAAASRAVAGTPGRSAKVAVVADVLRAADPDEVAVAVAYLAGELRQRRTGLGWASLRALPTPATEATLGVSEVDATFARLAAMSGTGSQGERRRVLADLLARATEPEQAMLRGLVAGELRQGALEGVMIEAVARAVGVPAARVRRAVMLTGAVAPVARAALDGGAAALAAFGLQVGRPVQPMLAASAPDVAQALAQVGSAVIEWKLDGIRVQVHRVGEQVRVFTRTLEDISAQVPEVDAAVRSLPVQAVVLDGEVLALTAQGRPMPFQVTAGRVSTRTDQGQRADVPLSLFVFDLLHLDGVDFLDAPLLERQDALAAVVPVALRVPRLVTDDVGTAQSFATDALARGHEGVIVKALDAPYAAGRRGSSWVKVKPVHTLDLVVLAVEWGSGRRRGWLSNLHLGARDPDSPGGFVMLGKTFKGLTDEMLRWQTDALLALANDPVGARDSWVVDVRPELVVEIAFDGVQTSTRYPGGMALRFARVLRHRPDKSADQADDVAAVRVLHQAP